MVESLNKYEGSLILVSHDRYFISRIANKIWEIDDQKIREFKGNYAEWEDWKERRDKALAAEKQNAVVQKAEVKIEKAPPAPNLSNDAKKEIQKVKTQFKQLEEKLSKLNANKTNLEAKLADPEIYGDKIKFLAAETEYKKASSELDAANKEYEIVFEKLMELEGN